MLKSKVYILGAGPGSTDLISLRGLQILKKADCVIYDRLIGTDLLNVIPRQAKIIYVGKEHNTKSFSQSQINQLIIKNAKKYKSLVRLKGGNALIFGRASEELKCLVENNIDFEIIPGITAASAAAACAGIVLSDRTTASTITYVTGHTSGNGKINIDFKSLARLSGTIVFYMAVENMELICSKLIRAGLHEKTNAYVIANASLANQKIVNGIISDITEKCLNENIQPPAVLIIGKNCSSWLRNKPLFGKKILITRDPIGNAGLASKLAARGACAASFPTFEIQDLTNTMRFKKIVDDFKKFDWVFFTSPTGAKLFFNAIKRMNKDSRIFSSAKIACVGSETAEALESFNLKADFVPRVFTSQELARSFIKKFKPVNKKILLLRSELADSRLSQILKSSKTMIKQSPIYTAKCIKQKKIMIDEIDWIIFASGFAVDCFFKSFKTKELNKNIKIASIGPRTSDSLKKIGIIPSVEAKVHTIEGLIKAMENHD